MSDALPLEFEATDPEPPPGALKIIFFIVLSDLLGFGIIIPLMPLFAKRYQASPLEVALLFSIYSLCQFIASPILGAISDRHGRRGVLIFSQVGSAVGYLLLGLVMQFHWTHAAFALGLFYLSRLIDGLSGGNISAAQAYVSDVTTPANRAKGMGVLGAAFGIGFALGPFVGGISALASPALPGYLAAAASLGAMIMTAIRLPETRVHQPTSSAVWLHPSQIVPIFNNTRLTQLLLISFCSMSAFVMLESMGALFLSRADTFNWHELGVALYFGYAGLVIATVQGGLVGRLTPKVGEWPLAIVGPILTALGMATLGMMRFFPIVFILLLGATVNAGGRSLQTPALFSLISQNSDRRQQGVIFGLNQGLACIARAVGPLVAGWIYATHPSGPFFLGAIILMMVCAWTAVLSGSKDKRPEPVLASAI